MAFIQHISTYIPEGFISNDEISQRFPDWNSEQIFQKIGIKKRRITNENEFVSDIAVKAINNLLKEYNIDKSTIDYLIICTQSPDYFLPTTACLVQHRVGLHKNCGAIDINQGCSGYIYGISLADALVSSGNFKNVILVTAETYSKYLHESDKGNISLFGDAATATLISNKGLYKIGKFSLGSDGSGAENLIVKNGGSRYPNTQNTEDFDNFLYMNGKEIFNFTAKNIPGLLNDNLLLNQLQLEEIDQFIFHQANTFMLNFLRKKIGIPKEKFLIEMENYGNTVSSTIPIAFKTVFEQQNDKVMLVGFGVGYSWGAVCLEQRKD